MLSPPDSDSAQHGQNRVSDLLNCISTYNGNVLLAAIISLLVVILFVLLLHIYARWFIARAQQRRNASAISRTTRFHNLDSSTLETTSSVTKGGLDPSEISSIPLFVYKEEEVKQRLECVICLSSFEENEIGRKMGKCEHSFHVGCIDMWLHSHSNCPLCRAPPMLNKPFNHGVTESMDRDIVMSSDVQGVSEDHIVAVNNDISASSSSPSLSSSLKRMLSRNRSERKIFSSPSMPQPHLDV